MVWLRFGQRKQTVMFWERSRLLRCEMKRQFKKRKSRTKRRTKLQESMCGNENWLKISDEECVPADHRDVYMRSWFTAESLYNETRWMSPSARWDTTTGRPVFHRTRSHREKMKLWNWSTLITFKNNKYIHKVKSTGGMRKKLFPSFLLPSLCVHMAAICLEEVCQT